MELKYKNKQGKKSNDIAFGLEYNEAFIATCDHADDRLVFVQEGKMIMALNLGGNFIIQSHHDLALYTNYKRLSKLEIATILEV